MAQEKYLIDTNAIIDYLGNRLPDSGMTFMEGIILKSSLISIISKIELLGFKTTHKHSQILGDFIDEMTLVELTSEIADATIQIRKNYNIKLPDSIIAATAISHNTILITRNISDFKAIKKLKILNPHSIT